MRSTPPFYTVCAVLKRSEETEEVSISGANCTCPTGLSQSCVHVTAMLLTIIEISPVACTSLPCVWTKPSGRIAGDCMEAMRSVNKDYIPYNGPLHDPSLLLASLATPDTASDTIAFAKYLKIHDQPCRQPMSVHMPNPLEILKEIGESVGFDNLAVEHIKKSLRLDADQRCTLEIATRGQSTSDLWIQARQWRVTASKFGVICNRPNRVKDYPPSLVKGILGDYSFVNTPAVCYGRKMESLAKCAYEGKTGKVVDECGLFVHPVHSYVGASPDGVIEMVISYNLASLINL